MSYISFTIKQPGRPQALPPARPLLDLGKHADPEEKALDRLAVPIVVPLMDLGKYTEHELPEPRKAVPIVVPLLDLGKRSDQASTPSNLIDHGKHAPTGRTPSVFPEKHQPNLSLVDYGKLPAEYEESTPLIFRPGAKVVGALMLCVVTMGGLWLYRAAPWAAGTSAVLAASIPSNVNNAELANDISADALPALQLAQLWQNYGRQLQTLTPKGDPDAPWWQIAASQHLTAEQTEALRNLQAGTLREFDRLRGLLTSSANGNLALLLASKDNLAAQQSPPQLQLPGHVGPEAGQLPNFNGLSTQ